MRSHTIDPTVISTNVFGQARQYAEITNIKKEISVQLIYAERIEAVVAMQAVPDRRNTLGCIWRLFCQRVCMTHNRCRCYSDHHGDEQVRGGKHNRLKATV